MTQRNFIAATLATLLAGSVGAAQTVSPKPDKFAVRVKMRDAAGKLTLVSVGELTRANGKVTARGLPAPAIDRLADDFIAAWKAYKYPPSVAVSESIASDTGMMPAYTNYTFTFTPKDRLYMPAVLREFVAKSGYEALGMTSVHFIDRDMTAEFPPNAQQNPGPIVTEGPMIE